MTKTPVRNTAKELLKWIECEQCSIFHSSADKEKHGEFCSAERTVDPVHGFKHSFIYDHKLVATMSIVEVKEDFPENWLGNFLFLHPDTITTLGFKDQGMKKPVVINGQSAFRIWPHKGVPLTTIGIGEEVLARLSVSGPDDYIKLSELEWDQSADEILFEFVNDSAAAKDKYISLENFKEWFFYYNEDRLFYVGEVIRCTYNGLLLTLIVRNIKVSEKDRRFNENYSDLTESISKLAISSSDTEANHMKDDKDTCQFFSLQSKTRLLFRPAETKFVSFGGFDLLKERLLCFAKETLETSSQNTNDARNVVLSRGLLLYGPAGSGKTTLVRAVADSLELPLVLVKPEDIRTKERLISLRNTIHGEKSCVVFFDDLDLICPIKDTDIAWTTRLFLCSLMEDKERVCMFAATNKMDDVHKEILQPGLFSAALKINMPKRDDRVKILKCLLPSYCHSLTADDVKELAARAQYFSGYDLSCLCKEVMADLNSRSMDKRSGCAPPRLTLSELVKQLPKIQPYLLQSLRLELPFVKMIESDVTWDDIGGLRDVKDILHQMIHVCVQEPHVYKRIRQEPLKGLFLFGPSGCGKTMIAKAVAQECGINFLAVEGTSVYSKYVGNTESNIAKLFSRAREIAPCVIFFDEADTVAQSRNEEITPSGSYKNRALQQMLVELDGIGATDDMVCVIAATNRPEFLDKAFVRPGRFDRVVYVPLPDKHTRQEILKINLRNKNVAADVQLGALADLTKGFSSSEIGDIVKEAVKLARQEFSLKFCLRNAHFETVLLQTRPRTTPQQIAVFEQFASLNAH